MARLASHPTEASTSPSYPCTRSPREAVLDADALTDLAGGTGSDVWSTSEWQALALSWLDEQLAAGVRRTGGVEHVRVRSWSTVISVPTTAGRVWFKAAGPGASFEVALYDLMREIVPTFVLTPIAADVDRGWMLLPDGGVSLADCRLGSDLVDALVTVLPRYGQMQRYLSSHVDRFLALGVRDMRPPMMPRRFERALAIVRRHIERHGSPADQLMYERLCELRATFASWSERLASLPGTASLDHNDLHPGNILLPAIDRTEQAKFFDWGESIVAHPFSSLLIPLRFVQYQQKVAHDHRTIQRLRDAYLEAFSDLAPRPELVEAVELACQMSKVNRTLVWASIARIAGPQARGKRRYVLEWLSLLLGDTYLGRI